MVDEPNQTSESPSRSEEPLYHYTDQKGLLGILETECLWATHHRFLNDSSEREGALDFFMAINRMASSEQHASSRYWNGLRQSLDLLLQSVDPYFVSFSNETGDPQLSGDRLSQWRGYALNRQGFSLGFRADYMKRAADRLTDDLQAATFLLPCIYDLQLKQEIAANIMWGHGEALTRIARERVGMSTPQTERIIEDLNWQKEFRRLQISFLNFTSQFKHDGFKEETEWRFAVYIFAGAPSRSLIHFRDGSFGRTPYIQIPLRLKDEDSPLRRIVVGPSQNKD